MYCHPFILHRGIEGEDLLPMSRVCVTVSFAHDAGKEIAHVRTVYLLRGPSARDAGARGGGRLQARGTLLPIMMKMI